MRARCTCNGRTSVASATRALACSLAVALLLASAPAQAIAAPSAPPVSVFITPAMTDGFGDARTGPVLVNAVPASPAPVRYRWDSPLGTWNLARGPIVAPQGERTLFVAAEDTSGRLGEWTRVPLNVVYPLRENARELALAAPPGGGVTLTFQLLPYDQGLRARRLGGADRYETASLITSGTFTSADTVVIATGRDFPDALAASGLAGCLSAPILLANGNGLHPKVRAEIQRLGASRAVIVGGTGAVSPRVEAELKAIGLAVSRLGGRTRYETSQLIADAVIANGGSAARVFVTRGDEFADALSLGPIAYRSRAPLLLTTPQALPPASVSALERHGFSAAVIAGGTGAVSAGVEARIDGLVGSVSRIAGIDRYETSALVAQWGVASGVVDYGYIGVATGAEFPDALCGGAAAGNAGGVVLLTRPEDVDPATQGALDDAGGAVRVIDCYGGAGAVSNDVFGTLVTSLLP